MPSKKSLCNSKKDLWTITREGSLHELESALSLLKKNGQNIDSRNAFGLTPLHIATWRNHVPIVKRLLSAGADPNARDGESGWSSLHRALHFGHLAVASMLLKFGASLTMEDSKFRIPIDLLSGPVSQAVGNKLNFVSTEVLSWGSGANYQLGTGNAHIQKLPCKIEALQDSFIKIVASAKFHSVAVNARGEIYTWGFGRGGRLGQPDFDVHSGQAAVITPRQVTVGLGSRRVKAVAVAKHHTIIATEGGDVFTWGSNREGQLGYTSVDTQPTPRRVSSIKVKMIAVAAANKHSVAVSESGEIFTWGCNKEGQLGYGTSNSASNYTPRIIEYLKGKVFVGISAAKYHTIALGSDGEVFTWGHRVVTPRRVLISRNTRKSGNMALKFHRMERLHVISVAAGMVHSTAITEDGALFYWISSDPDLKCQQMNSFCGQSFSNISAGKYWSAAVTKTGDIYFWDGKNNKDEIPIPTRLYSVKRVISVSVGETHMLAICALYTPAYPNSLKEESPKTKLDGGNNVEDFDEDFMFTDAESDNLKSFEMVKDDLNDRCAPSLKYICEKVAAEFLVEPRSSIQLLEIADTLEADNLRKYCEDIAIRNLDYIFTVSASSIANASLDILAKMEKTLDSRSCEPWSHRRLPLLTATLPAIINSEEDSDSCFSRLRDSHTRQMSTNFRKQKADGFLQPKNDANQVVSKQVRALKKKLQQIEVLETKQYSGHALDDQQIMKIQSKSSLERALADLGFPIEPQSSTPSDRRLNKKGVMSRKQRRKNRPNVFQEQQALESEEIHFGTDLFHVAPDSASKEKVSKKLDAQMGLTLETKPNHCGDHISEKLNDMKLLGNIHSSHIAENPTPSSNNGFQSISIKKKNRKGGLSMFLSGALDTAPREVVVPLTPKSEAPVWGGVKISNGPTSLREIQNEQRKWKEDESNNRRLGSKNEDFDDGRSKGQVCLGSFLSGVLSIPISVTSSQAQTSSDGERNTPTWVASSASPVFSCPSLKEIQMQEKKRQQCSSHNPKSRTSGFSISSNQGSPSLEPNNPNRWFKPEIDALPSSIRSIQIEEKAMKDLKRFYSNVKLVRNSS